MRSGSALTPRAGWTKVMVTEVGADGKREGWEERKAGRSSRLAS